jgi:hypothetical protein
MGRRWWWGLVIAAGVMAVLAPMSPVQAGEQKNAAEPAKAEKPAGLVGTVVAVLPESNTLVVDVPHGKDHLLVGGMVTGQTKIVIGGKAAALENLTWGQKVRINIRRVTTGTELLTVEALDRPAR